MDNLWTLRERPAGRHPPEPRYPVVDPMIRTLDRYVLREILPPLFLSLLIFTFILEIPPVMDQLESLISKGVSWGVAGQILITLIPQALGLTIPMALLVGLLVGLGRMSGDREAVALLACGVSPYRLLRPVLMLASVAAAVHLWVMIWAIPDANQTFRLITYDVIAKQVESDVRPQVFFQNFPGWVLYARDVPKDRSGWKDVLVADTARADQPTLYMAARGRLDLNRAAQTVHLILQDGMQYSASGLDGRQISTYRFPGELIVALDPKAIFPKIELQRGMNELTIADLRAQAAVRLKAGFSPHPEIMTIHQKFSFPAACIVFAVIGLALGLTVAREGKLAGFVVGIVVIFAYYVLYLLADSMTRGFYQHHGPHATPLVMNMARWVPNIVLLPLGTVALIWRARWAEGRLPFGWARTAAAYAVEQWRQRTGRPAPATQPSTTAHPPGHRPGVKVVIRIPRMSWLLPNILDRYISRIYVRTAAISFFALLGLFYISTFIDRADKIFKGQATTGMVGTLLVYQTPQFVYYVIPIAALLSVLVTFGLLSRTSELSVMKACGISLYRIAAPLVLLGIAWSLILYGLEQQIMARANERAEAIDAVIRGRPPRTSNPLNRQWLVGRDGAIYHYTYYDPYRHAIDRLVLYRPAADRWQLESETTVRLASYSPATRTWEGRTGWSQEFGSRGHRWEAFQARPLPLESPEYFETEQPIAELMTVPQLQRHIAELAASGFNVVPLMVDLQRKLAFPFVTLVMTLLAIPFGVTMGRRGTLYGIGVGIVLALTYWIVGSAFVAIGRAGLLGPVMAAWAPNVIAGGTAMYLMLTART